MKLIDCDWNLRRLQRLRLCFSIVLLAHPTLAIDRDLRIDQLQHTAWTSRDGAPTDILALAQTTDGFLWLGATTGLYRFDGVQFERYQPLSGPTLQGSDVFRLLATPDGALWIGFGFGGVSVLRNGTFTNYTKRDGLPSGRVLAFTRDRHGVIWMAAEGGLARWERSRWRRIGADWNFSGGGSGLFADQQGWLWVGAEDRLCVLRDGSTQFQTVAKHLKSIQKFDYAPDGALWMAETGRSVRPVPFPGQAGERRQAEIKVGSAAILFDRQGSLWITTLGDGLRRVRYPEQLQGQRITRFSKAADIFTHENGLTNDFVHSIFEDREGTIWVGTHVGLDRFRQSPLVPISLPSGAFEFSLAARDAGVIWANTWDDGFFQIRKQAVERRQMLEKSFSEFPPFPNPTSDYVNAFSCLIFGRRQLFHLPEGATEAITKDRRGRMWVSTNPRGVMRWENGTWISVESLGGPKGASNIEFADWQGRLWLGYDDNTVAAVEGDKVRSFSRQNGIAIGNVLAIGGRDSQLWIGGDGGLAFLEGDRFYQVIARDGQAFSGVYGMVAAADGLWLSENRGIVHISQPAIQKLKHDPQRRADFEVFASPEGLNAQLQRSRVRPSVVQGSDGVIWFATSQGLVWVDPNRPIPRNTLPPPVLIRSLVANNRSHAFSGPIELPVRTSNIQIDYTALSLAVPERVRFRYKLEGLDQAWQEAGTRRAAFYTNLGPGSYRFRVIACNNDGVWNESGAFINFLIPPAVFQTYWFRAAWITISLVLIGALYQLRLRRLRAEHHARLAERLSERERIARELHDTLLQGVQGLILRFQAAAEQIPANEPARATLEGALDRADQVVAEGRESVLNLRVSSCDSGELPVAFAAIGDDLAKNYPGQFKLTVNTAHSKLHPITCDEIYRIGREAITNAFQHAKAQKIGADLAYSRTEFRLRIYDDGQGLNPEILHGGYRPGHWGLPGMQERAKKIGADLKITSRLGSGTEIVLRVPAENAYQH